MYDLLTITSCFVVFVLAHIEFNRNFAIQETIRANQRYEFLPKKETQTGASVILIILILHLLMVFGGSGLAKKILSEGEPEP